MPDKHGLEDLLNLLPRLKAYDGKPLDEAARALGLQPAELLTRMERLSSLRFGDMDRGELIDCWVEDGILFLHSGGVFDHVVRLSRAEMMAILFGAITLGEQNHLLPAGLPALLERVEKALGEEGELKSSVLGLAGDSEPFLEDVRQAVEDRTQLVIWYYSLSSARYRERTIDPWTLTRERGRWYLYGFDHSSGEPRTFRLDRIGELQMKSPGSAAPRPEDFQETPPEGGPVADLLLDPLLARVAREQGWKDLEPTEEGLVWRPAYEDPGTFVAALLPFAEQLQLRGPVPLIDAWREAVRELLLRHGTKIQDLE
jgi:predicted DNA-binding transcriptional regulator YafY